MKNYIKLYTVMSFMARIEPLSAHDLKATCPYDCQSSNPCKDR